MTEARENVFVYGTLRRGGSNHFRMEGAAFVSNGIVRGRMYRIVWYPALILDAVGDLLKGEVFAVGVEQLAALDRFEGSAYRRVKVAVDCGDRIEDAWLWEWQGPVDESRRIASGDWLLDEGARKDGD
jgi:gamma-glutamylcyclotransferase (GGCT)/AIG2-like uncharacterized protein YtfP